MKIFLKKHTWILVIGIMIFGLCSNLATGIMQSIFAKDLVQYYWIMTGCKCAFAILPVILMVKWGYIRKSSGTKIGKGFLIGAISILFCLPNVLPYLLIDKSYMAVKMSIVIAIAFATLSIGLIEEAGIRGVLLPLVYEKWNGRKHAYFKAAIISSLIFGCMHLNWSVRYLLEYSNLPMEYLLGNLYQVCYTFCFGIFASGVTIYTRSIVPMVFWHGVVDFSAFIPDGLYPTVNINYFSKENMLSMQHVLDTYGIPVAEEFVEVLIHLIFVAVGFILIRKAEKDARCN